MKREALVMLVVPLLEREGGLIHGMNGSSAALPLPFIHHSAELIGISSFHTGFGMDEGADPLPPSLPALLGPLHPEPQPPGLPFHRSKGAGENSDSQQQAGHPGTSSFLTSLRMNPSFLASLRTDPWERSLLAHRFPPGRFAAGGSWDWF